MNEEERIAYNTAQDIPEAEDDGYTTDYKPMDITNVLDGTAQLDVSHAGGEFWQIMEEELHQQSRYSFIATVFLGVHTHYLLDRC